MIITVIGSLSKIDHMENIKRFFEDQGHTVYIPVINNKLPLIKIDCDYIDKIEKADLIIAVPKELVLEEDNSSCCNLYFGESTTYELAIAYHFHKRIIIG